MWYWYVGCIFVIFYQYGSCFLFSWDYGIVYNYVYVCFFCDWWGLCRPEASLISVSNLVIDLIHSEMFIIDLIPLFHNLYLLQVFLATLETTIILLVAPIMMMMMLRSSNLMNTGIMWVLEMMRLSVKNQNLSQCPPLPVCIHSFPSLFILNKMVSKALARGLVLGR